MIQIPCFWPCYYIQGSMELNSILNLSTHRDALALRDRHIPPFRRSRRISNLPHPISLFSFWQTLSAYSWKLSFSSLCVATPSLFAQCRSILTFQEHDLEQYTLVERVFSKERLQATQYPVTGKLYNIFLSVATGTSLSHLYHKMLTVLQQEFVLPSSIVTL